MFLLYLDPFSSHVDRSHSPYRARGIVGAFGWSASQTGNGAVGIGGVES